MKKIGPMASCKDTGIQDYNELPILWTPVFTGVTAKKAVFSQVLTRYFTRCPHFSSVFFRTSGLGILTKGNLSLHSKGLVASMMAREFQNAPFALSSGLIRGSSAVLHAR